MGLKTHLKENVIFLLLEKNCRKINVLIKNVWSTLWENKEIKVVCLKIKHMYEVVR